MLTTEKYHVKIFFMMVTQLGNVFCEFLHRNMCIGIELSLANILDKFIFHF